MNTMKSRFMWHINACCHHFQRQKMCAQSTCPSTGGCVAPHPDADPHPGHYLLPSLFFLCLWESSKHFSFLAGFFLRESLSTHMMYWGGQSWGNRGKGKGTCRNMCSPLCSQNMFPEHFRENHRWTKLEILHKIWNWDRWRISVPSPKRPYEWSQNREICW